MPFLAGAILTAHAYIDAVDGFMAFSTVFQLYWAGIVYLLSLVIQMASCIHDTTWILALWLKTSADDILKYFS